MKDYEKLTEKLFGLINNLKELIPPNEERQKDYEALEKVATDIAAEFDDMERCIDEMVQDQKQHEKELKTPPTASRPPKRSSRMLNTTAMSYVSNIPRQITSMTSRKLKY